MRIVSLLLFCVCVAILCGSAATQTWNDVCPDYDPNDSTTVICYLSSFSPPPLNDLNTLINGAPCQNADNCTIIVSPWAFQSEQNTVNQSSTRAFIGTNDLIPTYCCDPSKLTPSVPIKNVTINRWDECIEATYNFFATSWLKSFYPCMNTKNFYMVSGLTLKTPKELTIKAADGDQVNFAVTADSFYVTNNATCNLFVITQGTITLQNVNLWSDPACSYTTGPVKKHTMLSVAPILYQPLATSNQGSLTLDSVTMYNAPFIALIIMPDAAKNRPNITFTADSVIKQPAPQPPAAPPFIAPDFPSLTWNKIPNFWDIILIDPNPTDAPIPIVNGNLKRITLGPRYMQVNQTDPNYLNITPAYTSCPAAKPAANPCTTIERTNRIIEGVLGAVLGLGILVAAFQVKKFYTHHHIQIQIQTQTQPQTQT